MKSGGRRIRTRTSVETLRAGAYEELARVRAGTRVLLFVRVASGESGIVVAGLKPNGTIGEFGSVVWMAGRQLRDVSAAARLAALVARG